MIFNLRLTMLLTPLLDDQCCSHHTKIVNIQTIIAFDWKGVRSSNLVIWKGHEAYFSNLGFVLNLPWSFKIPVKEKNWQWYQQKREYYMLLSMSYGSDSPPARCLWFYSCIRYQEVPVTDKKVFQTNYKSHIWVFWYLIWD